MSEHGIYAYMTTYVGAAGRGILLADFATTSTYQILPTGSDVLSVFQLPVSGRPRISLKCAHPCYLSSISHTQDVGMALPDALIPE